jgi:hypothetical protein
LKIPPKRMEGFVATSRLFYKHPVTLFVDKLADFD